MLKWLDKIWLNIINFFEEMVAILLDVKDSKTIEVQQFVSKQEDIEEKIMDYYRSMDIILLEDLPPNYVSFYGGKYWIVDEQNPGCYGYAIPYKGNEGLIILNWPHRVIDQMHWEQAWLDIRCGAKIARIITEEEEKYRIVLNKYKHVDPLSMTPAQACIEWHSKGMPLEIAEEATTDLNEFKHLVNEHIAKSPKDKKGPYEYTAN